MSESMLDALDQLKFDSVKKGPECSVGALRRSFDEETWAKLCSLIDERSQDGRYVEATRIASVLQEWGYSVNAGTIARHRKRLKSPGSGCLCPMN
jgi:hypothetical protein